MRRLRFVQPTSHVEAVWWQLAAVFQDAQSLSDAECRPSRAAEPLSPPPSPPRPTPRRLPYASHPATELPAGHPVVGTTGRQRISVQFRRRLAGLPELVGTPPSILYEERASFVWMHQPVPGFEPWGDRAAFPKRPRPDLLISPMICRSSTHGGWRWDIYVPPKSPEAVGKARPTRLSRRWRPRRRTSAPRLFTVKSTTGADAHGRMFRAAMGTPRMRRQEARLTAWRHLLPAGAPRRRARDAHPPDRARDGRPSRIEIAVQEPLSDRDTCAGGGGR
jgi:hypothetical protein